MQKILIYGAGVGGERLWREMQLNGEPYELIAFVDKRIGGTVKDGVAVIFPEEIVKYEYDIIFVATIDNSVPITLNRQFHVPSDKINHTRFFHSAEISVRVRALERFRDLCDIYGITGSIAEVGVYQGDFAKHMNRIFPESRLYLYDTFEGFKKQDIDKEENKTKVETYHHYADTTVGMVMDKLPYPDKAVIRKGFFPDTAVTGEDKYVFVNLDADLYAPTLAGLNYFWPQMADGGVIFIHDFFAPEFTGVKKAVTEFMVRNKISISPLGDFRTVSIAKPL